jgi:hypothetical protein
MVLLALLLYWLVNPWFLARTAFVGANLLQSAFTRWCPLATILRRAGMHDPVPEDARSL